MTELQHARHEQSFGELLAELTREITTLVRQEAALAKAEMSEKASRIGRHLGLMAAGGAVAYAGLLAIMAAIIITLAQQTDMSWWASAFVVGVVVVGLGGFLAWTGLNALKRVDLVPRQTIETIKEDL